MKKFIVFLAMSSVINLSFFANNTPSNPKPIPILLNPIEYQNLTAKEVEKLRKDYSLIDFVLETIKENTKNLVIIDEPQKMDLDTSLDQKNDFMFHMIDPQTNQLAIRFPHLLKDKCILTKVQWQDNSSGTITEKVENLAKKINIKSEEKAFKKAFKDGLIWRIKIIIGFSACSFIIQTLRKKPTPVVTKGRPVTMPKKILKIK